MITKLGTHQGYAVMRQECEGRTTLHAVESDGRGQWDPFPLLWCDTFEQATAMIDEYLAYQEERDRPLPDESDGDLIFSIDEE